MAAAWDSQPRKDFGRSSTGAGLKGKAGAVTGNCRLGCKWESQRRAGIAKAAYQVTLLYIIGGWLRHWGVEGEEGIDPLAEIESGYCSWRSRGKAVAIGRGVRAKALNFRVRGLLLTALLNCEQLEVNYYSIPFIKLYIHQRDFA